jgi:exopolyphosphatase/guanosine-5'-triphosphate,3'-diphosphate pyrophosphatase
MNRAGVDIGTNTMRLLVVDGEGEPLERRVEITGLGAGFDATGSLADAAVDRTVEVLGVFGRAIADHGCGRVRVVATAASRDAANGDEFIVRATDALGHHPEVIGGVEEARLAYAGAMGSLDPPPDVTPLVVDVGGGSTEFVDAENAISSKIGSVRITDRMLNERPVGFGRLVDTSRAIEAALEAHPEPGVRYWMVGVAGTWTSIAGLLRGDYIVGEMHGSLVSRLALDRLVITLAATGFDATGALPGLHPKRARVILGGAMIAREAMRRFDVPEVTVSESDLLDALVL